MPGSLSIPQNRIIVGKLVPTKSVSIATGRKKLAAWPGAVQKQTDLIPASGLIRSDAKTAPGRGAKTSTPPKTIDKKAHP